MPFINRLKAWWESHLRHKLLVSTITTVVISLVLLGGLSFRIGQEAVRNTVDGRNRQLATLVARDINEQFDNISGNVRLLAGQLESTSDLGPQSFFLQAGALLTLRRASPLTYRALYLFDGDGNMVLHLADRLEALLAIDDVRTIITRPAIPLTPALEKAVAVSQQGRFYISETAITGPDQTPVIIIGLPFVDAVGMVTQIIVAEIDLRDVWRRVDEMRIGETGRVYVVARDGTIIAHPDRRYIGQTIPEALQPVVKGFEGVTEYDDGLTGQAMLAAYSPVGGQTSWGVIVDQAREEALAPVNVVAFVTFGLVGLALALATVSTVLIARSVTNPIQDLAVATQEIARTGDLSQDVPVEGHDEVGQLATTFNQMMSSLRDAQTRLLAAQAVTQELRIAHQIQTSLLPPSAPSIQGLDVSAITVPAREVGGDFYDYYRLHGNFAESLVAVVGDVSGKGTPAALYMAVSASALAAKVDFVPDAGQLCRELNAILYPRMTVNRMNTAMLYVRLTRNETHWHGHMVNAGLIAPLLRRNGRADYVDVGGLPLGMVPQTDYSPIDVSLHQGDWLIMCSDGIIEAMDPAQQIYGLDRLQERVIAFDGAGADDLLSWIMADLELHTAQAEQHDDMTMVVVHIKSEAGG